MMPNYYHIQQTSADSMLTDNINAAASKQAHFDLSKRSYSYTSAQGISASKTTMPTNNQSKLHQNNNKFNMKPDIVKQV